MCMRFFPKDKNISLRKIADSASYQEQIRKETRDTFLSRMFPTDFYYF